MVRPDQLEIRTAEQAFEEVLEQVSIKELTEKEFDRSCGICQEQYTDYDRPVRLPCDGRHVIGRQCAQRWLTPGETGNCPFCREVIEVPPVLPLRCSWCTAIIGSRPLDSGKKRSHLLKAKTRLRALSERGPWSDEEFMVVHADQLGSLYPYILMSAVDFVCSAEILEDTPMPVEEGGYYNLTNYGGTQLVLDAIKSEARRLDGQTVCRQDLHTAIYSLVYEKLDQITSPEVKAQCKGGTPGHPGTSQFELDFIWSVLVFTEDDLIYLMRILLHARVRRQE